LTARTFNLGQSTTGDNCDAAPAVLGLSPDSAVAVLPERAMVREIVFVDPGISDLDTLLQGVRPGIETHLLTTDEPALVQMARAVAGRGGLEAIHVISHGKPGEVSFSAGAVATDDIERTAAELAGFGRALGADGALLIWACETGAGERGAAFLDALAQKTGVRVAAASGLVGAAAKGGTWTLDRASGQPLTAEGMEDYTGVMARFTIRNCGGAVQLEKRGVHRQDNAIGSLAW
jgi:hypothetical protein